MGRGKTRRVFETVSRGYPGPPDDLVKLLTLDPALAATFFQRGLKNIAKAPVPALFDLAYAARRDTLFRYLPAKSPVPYHILSQAEEEAAVAALTNALEAKGQSRRMAVALAYTSPANPAISDLLALAREEANLPLTLWLAKNFGFTHVQAAEALANACVVCNLDTAKVLFNAYADAIDWRGWLNDNFGGNHPFYQSVVNNRAKCAAWLATQFDVKYALRPKGEELWNSPVLRLFWALEKRNNVAAVRWLLEKYNPLPTQSLNTDPEYFPGTLEDMIGGGRKAMAMVFAKHYNLKPGPGPTGRAKHLVTKIMPEAMAHSEEGAAPSSTVVLRILAQQ